MSSGGSSGPTQSTVTNTNIPEYAAPYVQNMLGRGEALTDINQNPYQTYGGQQIAGPSGLQSQSFEGLRNATPTDQTYDAAFRAGQTWDRAGGLGNYAAANPQNFYSASNLGIQAPTQPNQVGIQDYTGSNVSKYMSPYMQSVVDVQKDAAIRDYSRSLPSIGASAAQVGGLGGTRNALMVAEAQRNLQDQLAGIQATGSQSAFENARNQFNVQQQAGLQAGIANQNAGLQSGAQSLQAQIANQNAGG